MNASVIEVYLYQDNTIVDVCTAMRIGLFGVHVDVDPFLYPQNTQLEVEIIVDSRSGLRRCKVPAVVTSFSSYGVGMTFSYLELDAATSAKLHKLMGQIINTESTSFLLGVTEGWAEALAQGKRYFHREGRRFRRKGVLNVVSIKPCQ